jgi:hypothetical protein
MSQSNPSKKAKEGKRAKTDDDLHDDAQPIIPTLTAISDQLLHNTRTNTNERILSCITEYSTKPYFIRNVVDDIVSYKKVLSTIMEELYSTYQLITYPGDFTSRIPPYFQQTVDTALKKLDLMTLLGPDFYDGRIQASDTWFGLKSPDEKLNFVDEVVKDAMDSITPPPSDAEMEIIGFSILQRDIDQLATPGLDAQAEQLANIRHQLEGLIALGGEKDSHYHIRNVRVVLRGELLPRAVKMVGVYRKLLEGCNEVYGEEKKFLESLDEAIWIMERLVI